MYGAFQHCKNDVHLYKSLIMKSAFGSKRKARKIQVDDDEDDSNATTSQSLQENSRKYSEAIALNTADSK